MKASIKSPKSVRNSIIESWRIIYCLVILGFHFFSKFEMRPFHAGYLGVEFFFLLSGLGIYRSYVSFLKSRSNFGAGDPAKVSFDSNDNAYLHQKPAFLLSYMKKRLIRLYPLYLCSMICMLIVKIITHQVLPSGMIHYMKDCLAEFFMLQCSPLGGEVMIAANWYVASLFWGSLFWMILLLIFGKAAAYILAPCAALSLYGYYFATIGKIDVIFSYHAFLRGLAGLGLGIILGCISELITKKSDTRASKAGLLSHAASITACVILAGIVIYTNFGHRSRIDFAVIALFFASLLMLLPGGDPLPDKVRGAIFSASSFTYPVYLFQMPVIEVLLKMLNP